MRAYIEGIQYAKTHRKDTMDILAKYLRTDDKDVLEDTYESIVISLIPEKPYPTQKGVQIILRELGLKDPAARSAHPEQFVDLSIVKELDSSGFIDRVYKAPSGPGPVATPAPSKEKTPVQLAETKVKPVAVEEKARPVAKQLPASSEKAPAAVPPTKVEGQYYVVKAGDSLSKIAARFYNSIGKWQKIYEANRDTLKNPDYIYVGMKLAIPADG
jgi:LysM repeat protein